MKKIYPLIVAFLLSVGVTRGQTDLTTAVDFTVTDVNGNSHNLFSILNAGKYVCIDFYFVTCAPCAIHSPRFRQAYLNFGCNTQEIFFMSIDNTGNDDAVRAFADTVFGGPPGFPQISGLQGGGAAIHATYAIHYYPTFVLIAPNRQVVEQDMWPISSAASFTAYFADHGIQPSACAIGINEVESAEGIRIFPTPADRWLTIESGHDIQSVIIYDMPGKKCIEKNFYPGIRKETLDMKALLPGIYLVEVRDRENNPVIRKIVKE
jgi:hypothetical protein